jgi:hypothetical protein
MRISGFTTTRPEMASTRTAEDFIKFLGAKPARLGIVSSLYDQYTTSALTEALMNVYTQEKNSKNSFQKLNTFMVEWDIKVERVKKVMIIRAEGNGNGGSDVLVYMPENYYQKYDTFIVEETRQQFIVMNRPQRLRDNEFLLVCKILDDNYDVSVVGDLTGKLTRFVTNYMPEMHEEGYTKYQSNLEKHRTYISSHRCDIDASAQYLAMEDVFIQIGKGDKDDPVYKMDGMQKVLLDNFMQVRNNKLLYGKSNMDKYGKPTLYEPETGRPIVTGDGIIAQIERFANKFVFSRLNTKLFNKALQAMVSKCEKATGNKFAFICNEAMWLEIQDTLAAWIRDWKTTGTFLFSKASNGYVDLGATYQSYEFAGNTVTFMIDRTLNIEFPNRKYGMFLDLTPDKSSGKAAINMFTFKNGELIHNYITGVGGRSCMSSGEVSSRVAASKEVMFGYAGVGVMNPYKAVILLSDENTSNLF